MTDPEFYVGYLPDAPHRLGRNIRRTAFALLTLAGLLALALVFAQARFPASTFEFQKYKEFEGLLREHPYPTLVASQPYLLVAPGKYGAGELVHDLDERTIRLKGSLIYRDGRQMIEALPGTIAPVSRAHVPEPPSTDLGMVVLKGEIVDSKCYLGVMNPGHGKVHRDCAVRCISGGIPPALIARDASGVSKTILIADAGGLPLNRQTLSYIAEPVEVRGRLLRFGDLLTLEADPASIRRLSRGE